MAEKISGMTAGTVAEMGADTTGIETSINLSTVPATRRMTFGQIGEWLRTVGFAAAIAAAASPAAINWAMPRALGVDNIAGSLTITAPLSTGAGTPAQIVLAAATVGTTGSTLQTATNTLFVGGGTVGIASAAVPGIGLLVAGSPTASVTRVDGMALTPTLVPTANSLTLNGLRIALAFTPGVLTGLPARGINIASYSVAAFTSPGDPVMISTGTLTGTGATNAYGFLIGNVTGATNNFLVSDVGGSLFQVASAGNVGIMTAAVLNNAVTVTGSVTAIAGSARGFRMNTTMVAGANNDGLTFVSLAPAVTPGAFTGLIYRGINIGAFSVAAWTSPADPAQMAIGVLTATGATNASALILAPPTGASNNYLLSHTTAATFNVLGTGAITTASTLTVGGVTGLNAATTITTSTGNNLLGITTNGRYLWQNHGSAGTVSLAIFNGAGNADGALQIGGFSTASYLNLAAGGAATLIAGLALSGATAPSHGIQFGTSAPGTLANGQIWYDGTNLKARLAAATVTIVVV